MIISPKTKLLLLKAVFLFFFFVFVFVCFLNFLYLTETRPTVIQSTGFTNDYYFPLVLIDISSRHSKLNFAHHFVIY